MGVIQVNWHPSGGQLRAFSTALVALAGAVAAVAHATIGLSQPALVCLCAAVVLGLAGLVQPAIIRPVYVGWMALAFPVGWLVAHVLLAMLFYLLITPLGIILRVCGHDAVPRRFDRRAETYWKERDAKENTARYFKQY